MRNTFTTKIINLFQTSPMFFKLIRISHWSKNFFMFAPLFFSGQFTNIDKLYQLVAGFLSFCLVSSSVYIFNDISDLNEDRIHLKKKSRPLAAGKISVRNSIFISMLFLTIGMLLAAYLNPFFLSLLGIYLLINILYTLKLKEIAILDVSIIAIGFVLRISAGGILVDVSVSHWLVIMTFLLALFLAFAKKFDIQINEVFIHQLKEGVFYSLLICESNGVVHEIDSRTSDAIALAVRFDCPIYTTEEILDAAGISIDDQSIEKPGRGKPDVPSQKPKEEFDLFKNKTLEELERMLDAALNNEDYMKAAQIRDEIDKRK